MQGEFSSDILNVPAVVSTGTNGAKAISASSDGITVIEASSAARTALLGGTNTGIGVVGSSVGNGVGVLARSENGTAVSATSSTGDGVLASSEDGFGVLGECTGPSFGVVGIAANAGVAAFNANNTHAAYLASDCCAAWFTGDISVTGAIFKGGGGFRIDHPMNPAGKFLSHSFVESSEMKNIYDGTVVADAKGEAVVVLPEWMEALNVEFRYQLTPIGRAAPGLHLRDEISNNRFTIAGAEPGMRVSWQITGVRHDKWASVNRINVEHDKVGSERDHYIHPHLYNFGVERGIGEVRHPKPKRFPRPKIYPDAG